MDGSRFDNLSRAFSLSSTRRSAIRAAVATAIGGASVVALAESGSAQVVCRSAGQACTRNKQCCSDACDTRRSAPSNQRNKCYCPNGRTDCGNACVDLTSDENHCGACGIACGGGETCCNGTCRDLDADRDNCGTCGKRCTNAAHICDEGGCVDPCAGSGAKGYIDIDGELYTGFKDSDPWGIACSSNDVCEADDRCSGDPENPCSSRKRICERGKTKTIYASAECADLDRV